MSFPRYPKYKDSGVEWLGEVPGHWKPVPLKYVSTHNDEVLDEKTPPDEEIAYVDISSVDGVSGIKSKEAIQFSAAPSRARRRVKHGDVIVSTVRTYLKAIARIRDPEENLIVSTGFAVIRPRGGLVPDFLGYLLSAGYFVEQVIARSTGVSYPAINASELVRIPIPVPAPAEQIAIAAFLDRETAKIDALIEEQRRLMELLKEKRHAVISHAVTKGLNPDAPIKTSGVEWLGEVPEHWKVIQSRRLFRVRNESARPDDEQLTASQKYGMILQSEFMELEDRRVVQIIKGTESLKHAEPNDFVISLRSFQGGLEWCRLSGSITFHYVVLIPIKHIHEPFFAHLFKSIAYIQALRSTTNLIRDGQDLRYAHFVQVPLPIVPLKEQKEIAEYLDREIAKFDALSAEAQRAIDLLQERRSALISAAVTGQIDVRDIASNTTELEKPYTKGFARQLLAAEILFHCHTHSTTGRVKLQKLIHLCEHVAEIAEVEANYARKAAGPFDNKVMFGIASGLSKQKWFAEVKDGKRTIYRPLEKVGEHQKYLVRWESKMPKIRKVLQLLGQADTQQCEIVSTLYAAWNDLLIEGRTPSDNEIIHEASDPERWHENKAKIPVEKWPVALKWMRDKGLTPRGFGHHTKNPNVCAN